VPPSRCFPSPDATDSRKGDVAQIDSDHQLICNGVVLVVGAVGPPFGGQFDAVGVDDVGGVLDGQESSCYLDAVVVAAEQVIVAEVELPTVASTLSNCRQLSSPPCARRTALSKALMKSPWCEPSVESVSTALSLGASPDVEAISPTPRSY